MGYITDLLKDIPLSSVLKERLAIAEDKIETLESENSNFKELVFEKDQEIQRLSQLIQTLQKIHDAPPLKFIPPFYYTDSDPVPYCPTCWETDQIRIHFPPPLHSGRDSRYICPKCKNNIDIKE